MFALSSVAGFVVVTLCLHFQVFKSSKHLKKLSLKIFYMQIFYSKTNGA